MLRNNMKLELIQKIQKQKNDLVKKTWQLKIIKLY